MFGKCEFGKCASAHWVVGLKCLTVTLGVLSWLVLTMRSQTHAADDSWQGVWIGSWGGGMRDGVVFQPVIAELAIRGEQIGTRGFPGGSDVQGTFRIDKSAGKLVIRPQVEKPAAPASEVAYRYELTDQQLTLTTADKKSITFLKEGVTDASANVSLALVFASLSEDGHLIFTEYRRFTTRGTPGTFYQPSERKLNGKSAVIFVAEQSTMKWLSLAEAQKLTAQPALTAIAFRPQDKSRPHFVHPRWNDLGPVPADADAAVATVARALRPGTLLFVFPFEESVPQP
jgi:hypothetical protein